MAIVDMLNTLYAKFDNLSSLHDVYKVRYSEYVPVMVGDSL